MAKKILIGFIGNNDYKETSYSFAGGEPVKSKLVIQVLKEHLNPDKIYIIGTEKSRWDFIEEIFDSNVYEKVLIPFGYNEEEFWKIFDTLLSLDIGESELYIDVTHGFRSLPFFISVVLTFFEQVKSVKIKGLYYGIFETKDEIKPVVDLLPIIQLSKWINAYNLFKEYGDFTYVANLIDEFYKNLPNEEKRKFSYFKNINKLLDKTNISYGFNAIESFEENQKSLSNLLEENKNKFDIKSLKPIKFLFENLLEFSKTYISFQRHWQKQLFLGKEYFLKNRYAQSVTVLREFILTFILEELGKDWKNYDLREKKLNSIVFKFNNEQNSCFSDDFLKIAQKIKEYRNSIDHGFIRKTASSLVSERNKNKIGELIVDLEKLIEEYQKDEKVIFKNKEELMRKLDEN